MLRYSSQIPSTPTVSFSIKASQRVASRNINVQNQIAIHSLINAIESLPLCSSHTAYGLVVFNVQHRRPKSRNPITRSNMLCITHTHSSYNSDENRQCSLCHCLDSVSTRKNMKIPKLVLYIVYLQQVRQRIQALPRF